MAAATELSIFSKLFMGVWWPTLIFLGYDRQSELAVNMVFKIKTICIQKTKQKDRWNKAIQSQFRLLIIYTLLSFMIDSWHYNKDYNKIGTWKVSKQMKM